MLCSAQDNDSVLQCFAMHRIMIQCYSAQDNDSVLQCFVMHRIMIQYCSALFSGISNTEKIHQYKLFLWLDPIGKQ